jgi:hypothetical protein
MGLIKKGGADIQHRLFLLCFSCRAGKNALALPERGSRPLI